MAVGEPPLVEGLGPGGPVGGALGSGVTTGAGVGGAVGTGVGFGVGLGVGFGAVMTTRVGDTVPRVTERLPCPLPLVAAKLYFHDPAGNFLATLKVTPLVKAVPELVIRYRPTPAMTTSILEGAQPALSVYRTEKVIVVAVVPEDGEAFPALRTGASWDAPVQLAAIARSDVANRSTAAIALATANAVALAVRNRAG